MDKHDDRMGQFIKTCRENSLKVTPQRVAIYKELCSATDHPSADTIHKRIKKQFPNISLDTVNRTVLTFSELGLIGLVEGYGDPRRFDPNRNMHHHFQCVRCRKIIDFYNKGYDKLKVPEDINKKVTVLDKKVVLNGLCEDCR